MTQNNGQKKVVLAFSGGLDTTYCAIYLKEKKGLEVHTALVDTGGFSALEIEEIEKRAKALGVASHVVLNETHTYYKECIRYLIYGNVLRNNTYPLSVSAERSFQASAIARYAKSIQADYVAHGSTGAGNDQVRFDLAFQVLTPEIEILTPIRDQKLSRQEEIDFLKEYDVNFDFEKAKYSVNQGIWGTSVGGSETLTSHLPLPEEAYPSQLTKSGTQEVKLHFESGELKAVDESQFDDPVEAIQYVQELASPYAIGRDIHIGDTIIGIKGRVGFEAAAPMIIIKAHEALEKHTLTKWQSYWKGQLSQWYGMLLHEGQFIEPVMRNVEVFLEDTQKEVSGTVSVMMAPYRFAVQGVDSDHDLMSSRFGAYGEENKAWSGEDVKGFTKILSNSSKIYNLINHD